CSPTSRTIAPSCPHLQPASATVLHPDDPVGGSIPGVSCVPGPKQCGRYRMKARRTSKPRRKTLTDAQALGAALANAGGPVERWVESTEEMAARLRKEEQVLLAVAVLAALRERAELLH